MHQALIIAAKLTGSAGMLACLLVWRKQSRATVRRERDLTYVREPKRYPPLSPDPLLVGTERFLDTDEDDSGSCTYHYSGMHFLFTHGKRTAEGRCYDDTPSEFSIYLWPPEAQLSGTRYAEVPYRDPLLADIVDYVRQHEPERVNIKMLCKEGYQAVLPEKLAGAPAMP